MLALALRSFTHHRVAAVATGLVAMVGTMLVTAMAGVHSTGLAPATADADRPFLTQFSVILGGWIVAIVVFAMVSTVGVALQGRAHEIRGVRLIGATPRQVQLMIVLETTAVAVVAVVPGLAGGYLLGALLLGSTCSAGLIDAASRFAPGVLLPVAGVLVVLLASVAAAWIGSRAIAARSPIDDPAPASGARARHRPGRGRRVAAVLTIAAGLGSSGAVLGMDPDNVLTTAMTGPGCVLVAVGLCILAPELSMLANRALRAFPAARRSASAHLAAINLAVAPERTRPTVTFLTLFVGVTAGTLGMQGIENRVGTPDSQGQLIGAVNYLVVGLIAAFMAIALANNLVATIARRRSEFATLSLVGATDEQSRRMLLSEIAVAVVVSAVAGSLGALLSVLPFALVKTGAPLAAFAPMPYLLAVGAGAAMTLSIAALAGRRTIRTV